MKLSFRAIFDLKGKETVFRKSSVTVSNLIQLLKKEGINVSQIIRIEEFKVLEEKQRGRAKAKY